MQKELEGSLDTTLERFVYDCITNLDKISAPSRNVKQNNSIASSELRQVDVGRILLTIMQVYCKQCPRILGKTQTLYFIIFIHNDDIHQVFFESFRGLPMRFGVGYNGTLQNFFEMSDG